MEDLSLVYTSCDTEAAANALAVVLLKEQLAACIQIDQVTSHYLWQGGNAKDSEWRLQIKTRSSLFAPLAACIQKHHTYQVPEIIATPITHSSSAYACWLKQSLRKK